MRTLLALGALSFMGCTQHHHHYPPQEAGATEEPLLEASECAPLLPAPDALVDGEPAPVVAHTHAHSSGGSSSESSPSEAFVVNHAELKEFGGDGTKLVGLATRSLGATQFEVWRSSIPAGGETPLHVHSSEEVFVVLRGTGVFVVGEQELQFEAPATVIAPAGVKHQLKNTGTEATDQFVIVAIDSEIKDGAGTVMELPWRK